MTNAESHRELAETLRRFALEGVDLFGVASADRFAAAPAGTRPTDLMPRCRSVVVFAIKHLDVFTLTRNLACQAYSQDIVNHETLHQAYRLSRFLEQHGFEALPIVASVLLRPYVEDEPKASGRLSLRHAAELAGLGRIGRNALLLTPEFGPRVQLGAILTDAELTPSPPMEASPCIRCDLCIRECPGRALRAPDPPAEYAPLDAERCVAFRRAHGGQSPLGYRNACGICRAVCPVGRRVATAAAAGAARTERRPSTEAGRVVDLSAPKPSAVLPYKRIGGAELALHVFCPPDATPGAAFPAVVFFFGGGWQGGSPAQFYPHCAYLASRGMVAMSAEYRVRSLHGTTPYESVADAKSAIRWIRRQAADLRVDPRRLAAGGGSAGGHLAAAAALLRSFDEPGEDGSIACRPEALVLFNPALDNGPGGCAHARVQDRWREFSPLHNVAAGAPPTVMFLGSEDRAFPVASAEEFRRRMASVGARCDLWIYAGQPHGFFNYRDGNNPYFAATLVEADRFLASLGYLTGEPTLAQPEVQVERRGTDAPGSPGMES